MQRPGYLAGFNAFDKDHIQLWADAINARDADAITRLYAPNATLLATLDAKPLTGRPAIRQYFDNLVKKPSLRVNFQQLDEIKPGIWIGLYTFSWRGGQLPARFTFVIGSKGIKHHHSSSLPN